MSYATLADIEARYPAELITLAAHEETGLRDDARVLAALADASAETRAVLKARYTAAELDRLDAESLGMLKILVIDIAMYRIALSLARQNERVKERYETAIKRLEAIAAGRGGLSFGGGGVGEQPGAGGAPIGGSGSPNEVVIDSNERVFRRQRQRGL